MRTKKHTLRKAIVEKINSKMLFILLSAILVLIFASYAYLINKTIMNVVARESTERRIASLSTTIGELEFKHMTSKSQITLDLAYQKGFLDALPSQFLAYNGTSKITLNSQ